EHVGTIALERPKQRARRVERAGNHLRLLQRLLEDPANGLVVVDHPNVQSRCRHVRLPPRPGASVSDAAVVSGSSIWNDVRPGRLVNSISPPLRPTRSCAIVSPSPVPVSRPLTSG